VPTLTIAAKIARIESDVRLVEAREDLARFIAGQVLTGNVNEADHKREQAKVQHVYNRVLQEINEEPDLSVDCE
jgi:hypothetical protein